VNCDVLVIRLWWWWAVPSPTNCLRLAIGGWDRCRGSCRRLDRGSSGGIGGHFHVGKRVGRRFKLRLKSLEAVRSPNRAAGGRPGRSLPVNRRGILKLLREEEVEAWQETLAARRQAGYRLDLLSPAEVGSLQPGLRSDLAAAIYSPQDRQVQPKLLTQALLEAAQRKGSRFFFHQPVQKIQRSSDPPFRLQTVYTPALTLSAGHVILAAGLGSSPLAKELGLQVPLQAVKGQALRVKAPGIPLGPVVTDADLHLVPLGDGSLWVGATVEFQAPHPEPTLLALQDLLARAIRLCPALAEATLLDHWAGHRPRPVGQRAPILGWAPGYANLLIATGHYRNGVLLAPISAAILRDLVLKGETALCDLGPFAPRQG
jgi:glycine oxidase